MYYPRNLHQQQYTINEWRKLIPKDQPFDKPFMQPLYVDLHKDDDFLPQPIHLGFRIGANHLVTYLNHLQRIGVNHVALNLRFNRGKIEQTLEQLAQKVLPHFQAQQKKYSL